MPTYRLSTLNEVLAHLGFTAGRGLVRRKGAISAVVEPPWLTLSTKAAAKGAGDGGGQPGLWKEVTLPDQTVRRQFQLPLQVVTDRPAWDDETGDEIDTFAEVLAWVRITAQGKLPDGWQSPPADELEASLPTPKRTLQVGRFVRQAQISCGSDHLKVQLPLLTAIPSGLSQARRGWLEALLADAQRTYRMVRLPLPERASTQGVLVEVDLSGAPAFAVPELVRIGLDAARHVVSRLIWTSELLVDPAVTSTVWEIPPRQARPAKGAAQ